MKKKSIRFLISIAVCAVLISVFGCEPEKTVNTRQERLYSTQNIELQKKIDNLEKKYKKDLGKKNEELLKCRNDNEVLTKQIQDETTKVFANEAMNTLMEQVQKLTAENNELKAKIAELEKAQGTIAK